MEPLDRSRYERVRALIPAPEVAGHTAFAHAALDGWLEGRVFVDSAAAPASAIVCPDNGFLVAVGRPDRAVADGVVEAVSRDYLSRLTEERMIVATTPGWDAVMSSLVPYRSTRREFHFDGQRTPPPLPAGYRAEPLSEATACLLGSGIDPWVVRTLGGPAAFARRTFGTAVLAADGTLAAICAACGVGAGEAEIEIGTAPAHRRRGLALAAGGRFIDQCGERGLRPAWTCSTRNVASHATALRLGFRLVREVPVYPLGPELVRDGVTWRLVSEL